MPMPTLRALLAIFALMTLPTLEQARATTEPSPAKVAAAIEEAVAEAIPSQSEKKAWHASAVELRRVLPSVVNEPLLKESLRAWLAQAGLRPDALLTPRDQLFWLRLSEKQRQQAGAHPWHAGAWLIRRGQRWFVAQVFPGGPAARAGLERGDEVLAIGTDEDLPHRLATTASAGKKQSVLLRYRRSPLEGDREATIQLTNESYEDGFRRAARESELYVKKGKKVVGYFHLFATREDADLKQFQSVIARMRDKADALVLDLRGGIGGRHPGFLEALLPVKGERVGSDATRGFAKPLVILVDEATQGAAEWLAGTAAKQGAATLVGAPTAGRLLEEESRFVAGEHWLLTLPLADPKEMADALPPAGIKPDHEVKDVLMYASGDDPVFRRGLELATGRL